jgi:hypothetical protein
MNQINVYPTDPAFGGDFMKLCISKAEGNLPEWYKKSQSYVSDPNPAVHNDKKMTIKKCMPVFDYLSEGINLHLPFSIYSTGKGMNKEIKSSTNHNDCKIGHHSMDQRQMFPIPKEYSSQPYKVDFPYYIEAPSGYSALYVPYYPYEDYPLLFIGAMVQVDKYKAPVNFPFFIRNDFEGKINSGAVFMKVIFVKREEIQLNFKNHGDDKGFLAQYRHLVDMFGGGFYKNLRLDRVFPK